MPTRSDQPSTEEVHNLQIFLQNAGLLDRAPTGQFDLATYEALKTWQEREGLGTSGMFDPATRARLGEVLRWVGGTPMSDVDAKVYELYGPALGAYLADTELGPLLRQAAIEGWDELRLEGALQRTEWWQRTGEAARTWDEENISDPESANLRRRAQAAKIWDLTQNVRAGANAIDAQTFDAIVEDSLRYAWDDNQLMDMILSLTSFNPAQPEPGGLIGSGMARVKEMAAGYFINLSDEEAFNYARRIQAGELQEDGMVATFRAQARSRFANSELAQLIDNGVLPADYFAEHQRAIAQTLELGDPSTVDLVNDPTWSRILQFTDEAGRIRPMTVAETMTLARQQDEYRYTRGAQQEGGDWGSFFLKTFGSIKT